MKIYPFKKTVFNCKQATLLSLKKEEGTISVKERIKLYYHLLYCKYCRFFAKQSSLINNQGTSLRNSLFSDPPHLLSAEKKETIQQQIDMLDQQLQLLKKYFCFPVRFGRMHCLSDCNLVKMFSLQQNKSIVSVISMVLESKYFYAESFATKELTLSRFFKIVQYCQNYNSRHIQQQCCYLLIPPKPEQFCKLFADSITKQKQLVCTCTSPFQCF